MPQSWTIAGCQDTSRLLSVKPNQWTHLSPYYTRMHGEWLSYAKSTSQFHWRFLLSQRWSGLPSKSPMSSRHNVSFPSIRERYIRNRDILLWAGIFLLLSSPLNRQIPTQNGIIKSESLVCGWVSQCFEHLILVNGEVVLLISQRV